MSEKIATRQALGEVLVELAEKDDRIVALDADLAKSTSIIKFANKYPQRFFECGIAEQNMMNVAAGLAASGFIPFTGSFAMFATGRAFEQIRNSIAYPELPVKICPTHAGISVGEDGASHQAIEDIALMSSIPNMKVLVPADYYEAKAALRYAAKDPGPVYVRLGRPAIPVIFDEAYEFEYGRIARLTDGDDVAILACGMMVGVALEAAKMLAVDGIGAAVNNISTVKKLDTSAILDSIKTVRAVVTAEEHTIYGGLGSIIASVCAENKPIPVSMVGIDDKFGESGQVEELNVKYGLTAERIVEKVKKVLGAG